MFQFQKENHGVLRLYRFRDPTWEAKFTMHSLSWRWTSSMIHFYVQMLYRFPIVLSYQWEGLPVSSSPFWMILVVLCAGLACVLLGHTCALARRWIVELHFAFCVLVIAASAFICPRQVAEFWPVTYRAFLPNASYHVMIISPDSQMNIDSSLFDVVQNLYGGLAVSELLASAFMVMLLAALTGLNTYTVLILPLTVLGVMLGSGLTPIFQLMHIVWISLALLLMVPFFFYIASAVERWARCQFLTEALFARELHASQTADSILNHTLKNILSDAAATIELFLTDSIPAQDLESLIDGLRRGMRACKARQVYLKLVAREYAPAVHAVDLLQFGRDLVAGRDIRCNIEDATVHTDAVLLNLVLDNAICNAFKHGHPSDPQVNFSVTTSPVPTDPLSECRRVLHFTVTNVANPQRPKLTPEYVDSLMAGKADVPKNTVVPVLSDRVGIAHCVLAAEVGRISLHWSQEDDVVTFRASLETDLIPTRCGAPTTPSHPALPPFPDGLRFAVLDDSLAAQRLLLSHITTWCSPRVVHCFGERETDVEAFVATALAEADIIIVDQNLEYSRPFLGTDVVQQLVRCGFSGFICIRSANDSPEDQALYLRSGAHCCFGKDLRGKQLMAELKEAYCSTRVHSLS